MRILVTGATGYIGAAVADALITRGHDVLGLARSQTAASVLSARGIRPVMGDFSNTDSLCSAVKSSAPEAIISTASVGSLGGDARTFASDRDAVIAMRDALGTSGKALIFTSGSAVIGSFNGGYGTETVYDEDTILPLSDRAVIPASVSVHPMIAAGLRQAMNARVETEQVVLQAKGLRGIVIRPGLVYGGGGSFDVPALIRLSRHYGRGVHLGPGATAHSYVHIDDLAQIFCLAVENASAGAVLHAVTGDVTQKELASAVSRLLGAGSHTMSLSMTEMLRLGAADRIGLVLTARIPRRWANAVQGRITASDNIGPGISLSLDKRLSSLKTRRLLAWEPTRSDIIDDIESGSYA